MNTGTVGQRVKHTGAARATAVAVARFAIAALATFGIVLTGVPAARADTSCTTTMTGTIIGNLVVPSGKFCTLGNGTDSTAVTGNADVQPGATLDVHGVGHAYVAILGNVTVEVGANLYSEGGTIFGNVNANGCGLVALGGTDDPIIVGGNLRIQNCAFSGQGEGYSGIVTIIGNVSCNNNSAFCYFVGGVVGGNVQVNNNSSSASSVVGANVIGGNLQCQGNTPGVTNPYPNRVIGNEQGQCTGF